MEGGKKDRLCGHPRQLSPKRIYLPPPPLPLYPTLLVRTVLYPSPYSKARISLSRIKHFTRGPPPSFLDQSGSYPTSYFRKKKKKKKKKNPLLPMVCMA